MRYLSVCSGIEAATVAWHPLGWSPAGFAEIEPFPRAVLEHRQGAVAVDWEHQHDPRRNFTPLFGDFTQIEGHHVGPIDLLVGGTPCQDFSIAGLRSGLDGGRGNLTLEFARLADRTRPRWLVWENVPGVFSTNAGRDFGAVLASFSGRHGSVFAPPTDGWRNSGVVEPASPQSYGLAWRVLDAQFFGVPQRRRRVFIVGYLGDWRRAAAVLFERHSLQGHPAPRREARPTVAALTANGVGTCGADDNQGQAGHLIGWPADISPTLNAAFGSKLGLDDQQIRGGAGMFVAHALRGEGFDASEDGTGRGTPLVPVAYRTTGNSGVYETGEQVGALTCSTDPNAQIVAFPINPNALRGDSKAKTPSRDAAGIVRLRDAGLGLGTDGDPADTLQASTVGAVAAVAFDLAQITSPANGSRAEPGLPASTMSKGSRMHVASSAVRRLTPRECERLQGFPDDYTLVPHRGKPGADGPRYKALGNSMAVPVMRWIGERIAKVEATFPQSEIEP